MMSFYFKFLAYQHHMLLWADKKQEKMTEEFQKYKNILAREQKEFREEMEREASASLPFQLVKEKQDLRQM